MSTASSKKTSCGWQMLKTCVKIFACKHHANDTSRHPCAFETKPRNPGNASSAGRAASALALTDAVVTDAMLVAVVDLVLVMLVDGFVDDVAVLMLVDAVVDVVQLEVGVLDSTQQVLLLCEGFCT